MFASTELEREIRQLGLVLWRGDEGILAQMVSSVNCEQYGMSTNQLRLALCFSRISPVTLAPKMDNARSRRSDPMPKAKQLTVSCENRPGTLAQVARVLGDAKVNILAFLTTTSGTEGSVHLVVDNAN